MKSILFALLIVLYAWAMGADSAKSLTATFATSANDIEGGRSLVRIINISEASLTTESNERYMFVTQTTLETVHLASKYADFVKALGKPIHPQRAWKEGEDLYSTGNWNLALRTPLDVELICIRTVFRKTKGNEEMLSLRMERARCMRE